MNKFFLLILILLPHFCFADIAKIYDTRVKKFITLNDLITALPSQGHIILGEFHNIPTIQSAQAQIIKEKVLLENKISEFSLHWEFLNHTEQTHIDKQFKLFKKDQLSTEEFITILSHPNNITYAPIFDELKALNGNLFGLNISRTIKQKIIKEGISSIDQNLIPYHHYVGNEDYKARFLLAMGGHAPADIVDKYFLVQCLVDSIMADQLIQNEDQSLNFTIAGSFHTDFYDGLVVRLKNLTIQPITTLKIIDESMHSQEEIQSFTSGDPKFGQFADFIVITK